MVIAMSFRKRIAVLEAGENSWKTVAGSLAGGVSWGILSPVPGGCAGVSISALGGAVPPRVSPSRQVSPEGGAVRCARPHGP